MLEEYYFKKKEEGASIGNWEVIICLHNMTRKTGWSSGLYITQCVHWLLDHFYQMNIIFISWYVEITIL